MKYDCCQQGSDSFIWPIRIFLDFSATSIGDKTWFWKDKYSMAGSSRTGWNRGPGLVNLGESSSRTASTTRREVASIAETNSGFLEVDAERIFFQKYLCFLFDGSVPANMRIGLLPISIVVLQNHLRASYYSQYIERQNIEAELRRTKTEMNFQRYVVDHILFLRRVYCLTKP
jgi:hypothetical protein